MVLADYNLERANQVRGKLGEILKISCEQVDASKKEAVFTLARKHG